MLNNFVVIVSKVHRLQLSCFMWPIQAFDVFKHIMENPQDEIMSCRLLKIANTDPILQQGDTVLASYIANEVYKAKDDRIKDSVFMSCVARLFNRVINHG